VKDTPKENFAELFYPHFYEKLGVSIQAPLIKKLKVVLLNGMS